MASITYEFSTLEMLSDYLEGHGWEKVSLSEDRVFWQVGENPYKKILIPVEKLNDFLEIAWFHAKGISEVQGVEPNEVIADMHVSKKVYMPLMVVSYEIGCTPRQTAVFPGFGKVTFEATTNKYGDVTISMVLPEHQAELFMNHNRSHDDDELIIECI